MSFKSDDLQISIDQAGARAYSKVSFPLRYGRFSEIRTRGYVYQFNLNGELRFIHGRSNDWPNPSEWLKRTITNDWVYYSAGGYEGPYDCFGEYYVPCLSYPSNTIHSRDPFSNKAVMAAIQSWGELRRQLAEVDTDFVPEDIRDFIHAVLVSSPERLSAKAGVLRKILGDPVTVLPPDTRHVDYDVIPVIIADGCLYKCDFCSVKSRFRFNQRSRANIMEQVRALRDFFGKDLPNYNSLFLGQHDALHAPVDLVEFAAKHAYEVFDLSHSNLEGPGLFLFGSVASILHADEEVFERIHRLPFRTYINIGLESADQETLDKLGKRITAEAVESAFAKIVGINRRYENIEITSNFVYGEHLPDAHIQAFLRLMDKSFRHPFPKGSIYFSPLVNDENAGWKGRIKREFYKLKIHIPVPAFLYLIQKL